MAKHSLWLIRELVWIFFFANWYILNIHLCPSFPLSYHKCILLKTSFIRQHDPQFSSQRARSSPWWEGSRPWDSCWSSCWKFSAPRPGKEAPPITRALKKGQTKLYLWSKKNLLVFLGLDSLVSYLGGKAVEHKARNFALSTLTLFKTIANTILGSVSNSSTIDRILLEQTFFSRYGK